MESTTHAIVLYAGAFVCRTKADAPEIDGVVFVESEREIVEGAILTLGRGAVAIKALCVRARSLTGAIAVGLAACASAPASIEYTPPSPDESATARQARYDAWRAGNSNIEARLRRVAEQTAALIAAHPTPPAERISAPPEIFRAPDTGMSVWECPMCPEIVVTPAGRYTIGSPETETARYRDEGPRKRIIIGYALLVGRFEITREQYEAFVAATGYPMRSACTTGRAVRGVWALDPTAHFRDPAYEQTPRHPVACVSWDDAQAYVAWLNTQAGGGYRLLTESEWEFVARVARRRSIGGAMTWTTAASMPTAPTRPRARNIPTG